MIPGSANALLLTSAAAGGYAIERSLRFNSSDSAYLNATLGTATDQDVFTFALWVKRSALGSTQQLFGVSTNHSFGFTSGDALNLTFSGSSALTTTALFRDPSAWYHIAWKQNANAHELYVNGVSVGTATATSNTFNTAVAHQIAAANTTNYFNGYLADVHFIDGQALDPTSFGKFDANGIWQPIDASGLTYGTNGFHLDFSDNSTAAALGTDTSPNGNDWTVNNLAPGGQEYSKYFTNNDVANPTAAFNSAVYSLYVNTTTGAITDTAWVASYRFTSPWIPPSPIRINSTLDVYAGVYDNTATSFTITVTYTDGTTDTLTSSSGYNLLVSRLSVAPAGKYLESISMTGGTWAQLCGVRIDGTFLNDVPGSNTDSLVDVPTNGTETDTGVGGEVRGNYATWNPISKLSATPAPVNGNLTVNGGNASYAGSLLTTIEIPKTGKWYWEVTSDSSNWQNVIAGVADVPDPTYVSATNIGNQAAVYLYYAYLVTVRGSINAAVSPTYTTGTAGATYGFAADMDNGDVYLYHNGTIQNSGNPIFTNLNSVTTPLFPATTVYNVEHHWNFGQRPFAYTAPSGFKALCTANLPAPTIGDGGTAMDVALYTGNDSTQTISGLGFSPDLVWIKDRTVARSHRLFDTVRGATLRLYSDTNGAEGTDATSLTQFNLDGFDLGSNTGVNADPDAYVAWNWDAGSSTVTNNDGSISSQVRANPSAGFSIVSYTGVGGVSTVGHGLGVVPGMIIVKDRDNAYSWHVYHQSISNTLTLLLDLDLAATNYSTWNATSATSSVFTGNGNGVNALNKNHIAYCFAPVEGYSAFGSYTGNGLADGTFVYTGFRPRWVLTKSTSTGLWNIHDTQRSNYNPTSKLLWSDVASEEVDYAGGEFTIDCLSNGFKARAATASLNSNGVTYVYAAFAENPFALNARAR